MVAADATGLEVILQTERLYFIEMRQPRVELVAQAGARSAIECAWHDAASEPPMLQSTTHIAVTNELRTAALSILWPGEIWPKFEVTAGAASTQDARWRLDTLGARLQMHVEFP